MAVEDKYKNKRIIVVTGVPRSGTSAITRGLKVLGVNLGTSLEPADSGNEKGYFEDSDINNLNYGFLKLLFERPDYAILVDLKKIPQEVADTFKISAKVFIEKRLDEYDIFGLKDPFMSKVLPLWKDIFAETGANISYVIPCRNPISVARSINKRANIDYIIAYYIWFSGMLSSLVYLAGEKVVFVDYDDMLTDPKKQLQRISEYLSLTFDPNGLEFLEFSGKFLEESLRHGRFSIEDLESNTEVPPKIVEFYKLLRRLCADELRMTDIEVVAKIKKLVNWMSELSSTIFYMESTMEAMARLNYMLKEKEAKIEELNKLTATIAKSDNK
jgi:hypothetical protein